MAPKTRHKRKDRKVSLQTASTSAPKVSLVHLYAPPSAQKKRRRKEPPRVQPIIVDDPYALGEPAELRAPPRHAEKQGNETEREWIAPAKRPIEVLCSRRDVIAGMYRRGHMDKAMFLAARDYQRTYETAMAQAARSIDPSAPVVSGGGAGGDRIDGVIDAADALARIERRLSRRYGGEAVALVRQVLGQGFTIERAAQRRGDGDKSRVEWWGGMFRRCLEQLAEACGHAVNGAYRNRQRAEKRREDERKRQEHRDSAESKRRKRGKAAS